jgi:hypothetical protein
LPTTTRRWPRSQRGCQLSNKRVAVFEGLNAIQCVVQRDPPGLAGVYWNVSHRASGATKNPLANNYTVAAKKARNRRIA